MVDILAWVPRNIELEMEIKFFGFIGKWNIQTTIKKSSSEAGEEEKQIIDCKFLSSPQLKTHTHTHRADFSGIEVIFFCTSYQYSLSETRKPRSSSAGSFLFSHSGRNSPSLG